MNNKQLRKVRIKEIIRDKVISCQDDLLKDLRDEGFEVTQATLSRDLKKMKITKIADTDNTYRYIIPEETHAQQSNDGHGYLGLVFSGNMAVIKTVAGYASPLAVLMDNNPSEVFVGTIAGRDTIFIILNENDDNREKFKIYLDELLYGN
jgi:transcriptional regulator of arginine metabolism